MTISIDLGTTVIEITDTGAQNSLGVDVTTPMRVVEIDVLGGAGGSAQWQNGNAAPLPVRASTIVDGTLLQVTDTPQGTVLTAPGLVSQIGTAQSTATTAQGAAAAAQGTANTALATAQAGQATANAAVPKTTQLSSDTTSPITIDGAHAQDLSAPRKFAIDPTRLTSASTVFFNPTATQNADGVYNTWATAAAAMQAMPPFVIPRVIVSGSPTLPAGTWTFPNGIVLEGTADLSVVTLASGFSFGTTSLIAIRGIGMQYAGLAATAAPIVATATGGSLQLEHFAYIVDMGPGLAPMISVPAGTTWDVYTMTGSYVDASALPNLSGGAQPAVSPVVSVNGGLFTFSESSGGGGGFNGLAITDNGNAASVAHFFMESPTYAPEYDALTRPLWTAGTFLRPLDPRAALVSFDKKTSGMTSTDANAGIIEAFTKGVAAMPGVLVFQSSQAFVMPANWNVCDVYIAPGAGGGAGGAGGSNGFAGANGGGGGGGRGGGSGASAILTSFRGVNTTPGASYTATVGLGGAGGAGGATNVKGSDGSPGGYSSLYLGATPILVAGRSPGLGYHPRGGDGGLAGWPGTNGTASAGGSGGGVGGGSGASYNLGATAPPSPSGGGSPGGAPGGAGGATNQTYTLCGVACTSNTQEILSANDTVTAFGGNASSTTHGGGGAGGMGGCAGEGNTYAFAGAALPPMTGAGSGSGGSGRNGGNANSAGAGANGIQGQDGYTGTCGRGGGGGAGGSGGGGGLTTGGTGGAGGTGGKGSDGIIIIVRVA